MKSIYNKLIIRNTYNLSLRERLASHRWGGSRRLHWQTPSQAIKPFMLADIGEGIKECEVIQWFVEPGASVEEFDLICEVQSDKASVEITSRYSGVVKKLHYEPGEMAIVGKPLVDIDIPDEQASANTDTEVVPESEIGTQKSMEDSTVSLSEPQEITDDRIRRLATPAVRRLCKENELDIAQIRGTGKGSRVMKEDVLNHIRRLQSSQAFTSMGSEHRITSTNETTSVLTPFEKQMFNAMTKSTSIPHFLYTDEMELDNIAKLRGRVNEELAKENRKFSYMPFFIKALSLSLLKYPKLNSKVMISESGVPSIINRPQHNIGIAMDTPIGLIVPNIKNVQNLSVYDIGNELARLQEAGKNGKLSTNDLTGGTITLSNIGTVGGTYVGPVIVESEIAIGGIGRARTVPRYDSQMNVVPRTIVNVSWSGDHRVLDGVTMAKMVAQWKDYVENPEKMMIHMS